MNPSLGLPGASVVGIDLAAISVGEKNAVDALAQEILR